MNSTLQNSLNALSGVIRGKDRELRLALCCMLAPENRGFCLY